MLDETRNDIPGLSNFIPRSILVLAALFLSTGANAASLFDDDAIIDFTLRGPLHNLIRNKNDREKLDFEISTDAKSLPVSVNARGNSRLRVCRFPPLRLQFSKESSQQSQFEDIRRVKLVTHCNENPRDKGNVIDEYLAYRIFNLVSDFSYRVRLFRISYVATDEASAAPSEERWAFALESDQSLATRLDGEIVKSTGVVWSKVLESQATRVFVFQYLIGNTDYSLVTATSDSTCCHNGDLLEVDGKILLIPYDFDLSGLVNASYAKPDPNLSIRRVTNRQYLGYCSSPESLRDALQHIKGLKNPILELVEQTAVYSPKQAKKRKKYLEEFFNKAENEDKLLKMFERKCVSA